MDEAAARPWHAREGAEVLAALDSSPEGLSSAEAERRVARYGRNVLRQSKGESPFVLLFRQLNNPISWLLVASGTLAVFLGKVADSVVVYGAVVINALLGFIQEYRAGKEIEALKAMVPEQATVLRDGKAQVLSAAELVPGDVVLLASGDKIPADIRLLRVKNLRVDEAALTGESVPVAKHADPVGEAASLGDRTGMAYGGSLVTQGTATGVVVATGLTTELGRIDQLLADVVQTETPLTQQLEQVGKWLTLVIVALSLGLMLYGWLVQGASLGEALFTAVTLAVAAIPEGLPAIVTIALAIGVRRMAARRAVVRHLPSVETLGSTTVICSDKTGTLTKNEMTVQGLWIDGVEYQLTGTGYEPVGRLSTVGGELYEAPESVRRLLLGAVLCNDATLAEQGDRWVIGGDPTEAALVVAARKVGLLEDEARRSHVRQDVVPFESEHRYMATWNRGEGIDALFLKGAPEAVVPRCKLDAAGVAAVEEAQEQLAREGMRVLAVAERAAEGELDGLDHHHVREGFTLLGLVGMIDPPRPEAIEAVAVCQRAGIEVKMITGDHHATATAVGRQLGIVESDAESITGVALDRLDAAGMRAAALRYNIFARVAPEHKLALVTALQEQGHVVAMTGDGVNDAPALRRADIGVAMGIAGTAVSKEAAKIVLADDNFASISAAVEEGRRVYDNLVKAIAFVLPVNLGLAFILAAATFLFPTVRVAGAGPQLLLPMSPTQILWINLIASVALSAPLAFEVMEPGTMSRRPRAKDTPIFSRFVAARTLYVAVLMAAMTCVLFLFEYQRALGGPLGAGEIPRGLHLRALAEGQTIAVTSVVMFQIFYLLNCRSLRDTMLTLGLFSNPAIVWGVLALLLLQLMFVYVPVMALAFRTAPISAQAWLEATIAGSVVLVVVSAEKWTLRLRERLAARRAGEPGAGA